MHTKREAEYAEYMSMHAEAQSSHATLHTLADIGVVVVAAGRGERLGAAAPKAFVELDGVTLLAHCVRTVVSLPEPGHLVLVVPDRYAAAALEVTDQLVPAGSHWEVSVVHGGRERHESVRFGLDALTESVSTALIHDAARPLASPALFESVIAEVRRTHAGVIPTVPVADTLKRLNAEGIVEETVDRSALVAAQTPQGFPLDQIVAAHETAQLQEQHDAALGNLPTDDAEVLQRAGGTVHVVPGEDSARKITTKFDLSALRAFLTDWGPESVPGTEPHSQATIHSKTTRETP